MKTFKNLFDDKLHYVPAPKVASRTTLGWMVAKYQIDYDNGWF